MSLATPTSARHTGLDEVLRFELLAPLDGIPHALVQEK